MTTTAKFAWNEKNAAFFVDAYIAKLEAEGKVAANSSDFLSSLMDQFAEENNGLQPVSVRSVQQKLAAEKVYQKLEANEKPKTPRQAKGKKINQVAKIAEIIAKKTGEDEEHVFELFSSLENATAKCLAQLQSVLVDGKLLPVEDDGSQGVYRPAIVAGL